MSWGLLVHTRTLEECKCNENFFELCNSYRNSNAFHTTDGSGADVFLLTEDDDEDALEDIDIDGGAGSGCCCTRNEYPSA